MPKSTRGLSVGILFKSTYRNILLILRVFSTNLFSIWSWVVGLLGALYILLFIIFADIIRPAIRAYLMMHNGMLSSVICNHLLALRYISHLSTNTQQTWTPEFVRPIGTIWVIITRPGQGYALIAIVTGKTYFGTIWNIYKGDIKIKIRKQ